MLYRFLSLIGLLLQSCLQRHVGMPMPGQSGAQASKLLVAVAEKALRFKHSAAFVEGSMQFMASPERGRPQLQLELDEDLITNANALSLLDASDDLLSPSVMSKPAWRLDGNARQPRRGLLLSPAGCSSEGSSVATPAPPSDASWPTYAPGPLKVILAPALHGTTQQAWLSKLAP